MIQFLLKKLRDKVNIHCHFLNFGVTQPAIISIINLPRSTTIPFPAINFSLVVKNLNRTGTILTQRDSPSKRKTNLERYIINYQFSHFLSRNFQIPIECLKRELLELRNLC